VREGKIEPGDRLIDRGEERVVVCVWSGRDIIIPYPAQWRTGAAQERSALFASTPIPAKGKRRIPIDGE